MRYSELVVEKYRITVVYTVHGVWRIVTVAFLRRVQIFLFTYLQCDGNIWNC